jgi:hypothetical protein
VHSVYSGKFFWRDYPIVRRNGFRILARKDGPRVRLYSRPGNYLTDRFP